MLNKIINELEAKIEESKTIKIESTIVQSIEAGRRNAFKSAIYIIKNHESEFNHHPLSVEDIERAASKYAFENNTHRSNSKAFIAGANFTKQTHSKEWVSVSERLPEEHHNVLLYNGYGVIMFGFYNGDDFYETYNGLTSLVTHWMPLPHPPKK